MSLATYDDLRASIATWVNRPGDLPLQAAIPDMIAMAEREVADRRRLPEMVESTVLTLVDGAAPLPADYLETISLVWEGEPRTPVHATTADGFERLRDTAAGGPPRAFMIDAGTVRVRPPVDEMTLRYFADPGSLATATGGTHAAFAKYPSLYLYGALMHAAPFLLDDPRLATWERLYERAHAQAELAEIRWRVGSSPLRATPRVLGA